MTDRYQTLREAVLARLGSPHPPARVIVDPDAISALLNERDALCEALIAAYYGLRSYQYGNANGGLAKHAADHCQTALQEAGVSL